MRYRERCRERERKGESGEREIDSERERNEREREMKRDRERERERQKGAQIHWDAGGRASTPPVGTCALLELLHERGVRSARPPVRKCCRREKNAYEQQGAGGHILLFSEQPNGVQNQGESYRYTS